MEKTFNHAKASIADNILIIGELEHIRRHALRSAVSVFSDSEGKDEHIAYLILAHRAKNLRRDYMAKYFGDISEQDWCLCKAAASLRQLAYEVASSDIDTLKEIDTLVDDIWSKATGEDLSDCVACKDDKNISDKSPIDSE